LGDRQVTVEVGGDDRFEFAQQIPRAEAARP
jgi:hypothetical protein